MSDGSIKVKVLKGIAGNNVLLKMPKVLEWIESLGLRAINTRYTRYVKYVDDFFKIERDDLYTKVGQEKFTILTKALLECHNIIIVYSVFKNNNSLGFKERLSKVIKDPDILGQAQESKARNFLFELLVASYFSVNNYEIDFDSNSDVLAKRNDLTFYVECKKIVSSRKMLEKFKRAGKKLENDVPNDNNAYGLIFIDISSLIAEHFPTSEVGNYYEAHKHLTVAMTKFLTQKLNIEIELLNERFKKSSLAVCLIGSGSIWTNEPSHYVTTSINVRARSSMNDDDFNTLNKALAGFEGAFEDVFKVITAEK